MTAFPRPMDFGGSWYPADADECRRAIESYPHDSQSRSAPPARLAVTPQARLALAPHAGWTYSGRLAALAWRALVDDPAVQLVIVLGGHLRASDPIVAATEGEWETPFGAFRLHGGFDAHLARLEPVRWERGGRYHPDNSTELQLPFAKWKYPGAELLALRVPPSDRAIVLGDMLASYLETCGLNAVAVASTDLTHYGPNYDFTPKGQGPQALAWVREDNDPAFIQAVARGDPRAVLEVNRRRRNACSAGAVIALAELARQRGLRFQPLEHATSAEVAGEASENFVGYLAGVWG